MMGVLARGSGCVSHRGGSVHTRAGRKEGGIRSVFEGRDSGRHVVAVDGKEQQDGIGDDGVYVLVVEGGCVTAAGHLVELGVSPAAIGRVVCLHRRLRAGRLRGLRRRSDSGDGHGKCVW